MSSAILLGLVLGIRHAVDPDHVAALASLASRQRRTRDAGILGASWALGHGATLAIVGMLLLSLRISLPDAIPRYAEAVAGGLLIALGLLNLLRCRARAPRTQALRGALVRSAGIGLVHGLAGSGAITLLAVSAVPTALAGGTFLVAFSIGVAASMVGCSLLLGAPFARLQRDGRAHTLLTAMTGCIAVLLGSSLVWSALLADASTLS